MSEQVTNYLHTDEDGEKQKVRFTERFCGCSGKCYPDTLEVEDFLDGGYIGIDIDVSDVAFLVKELLDKSCDVVDS